VVAIQDALAVLGQDGAETVLAFDQRTVREILAVTVPQCSRSKATKRGVASGVLRSGWGYQLPGTPRTEPDGRLLANPVLISDVYRQSGLQDKDGAPAAEEATGLPA
jgi:hypothetical protein